MHKNEFFIHGLTSDGKIFRPSDWTERLCGAITCFNSAKNHHPHAYLQFSPYVSPTVLNGVKSVLVNEELKKIEPLAYHFLLEFTKSNDLQIINACLIPEVTSTKT